MYDGIQFYPTPKTLLNKIVDRKFKSQAQRILEPSAGRGDILDYIKESVSYHNTRNQYNCCEIDPNMQAILKQKGYNVVHNDFLSYYPETMYDTIIMNPPFKSGDKHLLHAWDILVSGQIKCILNAETVRNPYTFNRKEVVKLIENHGSVEFMSDTFAESDRKTNVEVAIITLYKEASDDFDFTFKNFGGEKSINHDTDTESNDIALQNNAIENMVLKYDLVRELFVDVLKSVGKVSSVMKSMGLNPASNYNHINSKITTEAISKLVMGNFKNGVEVINTFTEDLRSACWKEVFKASNISTMMTNKVAEEFDKFKASQQRMDFSVKNIHEVFAGIYDNKEQIMKNVIVDSFDQCTKYYKGNRGYQEGWKTNDAFKVNRKIIIPNQFRIDYHGNITSPYGDKSALKDLDKALCMIAGKSYDTVKGIIKTGQEYESGKKYDSEFFECRYYQKGTMHLKFKSEWIWRQFNVIATDGKNWLPDAEKQKEEKKIEKLKLLQLTN